MSRSLTNQGSRQALYVVFALLSASATFGQAPASATSTPATPGSATLAPTPPTALAPLVLAPVTTGAVASAASVGLPLTTASDITGAVTVDAVLLPYSVAKRSFGNEVAKKYAVVSMIVSNRDPKQSLILHSAFLDYSHWLFSGSFSGMSDDATVATRSWQQQNNQAQVASAEVRTVRTDLQDAQLVSFRSILLNILSAVGTTAATLSYSTANDLFAPSVAAFNSAVIPGLSLIWPDNTQTKVNLISDIGFRTNRVIPAKSSDVVIAFFPIDRFLTPTLKKIYIETPAAFFNPSELLLEDVEKQKELRKLLDRLSDTGLITGGKSQVPPTTRKEARTQERTVLNTLATAVRHYEIAAAAAKANGTPNPCLKSTTTSQPSIDECTDIMLLDRVSLNRIRLVIGGTMTIDVATVPATITSVTITKDTDSATWAAGQTISGVVNGTFLSGAALTITATDSNGGALPAGTLGTMTLPAAGASDAALPFTLVLGSGALPRGTQLAFTVAKTASDKSITSSAPFPYTVRVPAATVAAETKTATWQSGQPLVTIAGAHLTGASITKITGTSSSGALPAFTAPFPVLVAQSSDVSLVFKFTLPANIPAASTLIFTVTYADGTTTTVSYTVPSTLS